MSNQIVYNDINDNGVEYYIFKDGHIHIEYSTGEFGHRVFFKSIDEAEKQLGKSITEVDSFDLSEWELLLK